MEHISVRCFSSFHCIAGACPDTCCAGWEVDLDGEILEKYAACPGPLGQEIRSRIRTENGYTFFEMNGTRCPFLNDRNLCRLILEAGEDHLSITCREHPRFWEEYGSRTETCLAISCPEAARLLFSEPFRLTVRHSEETPAPEDLPDEELLESLIHVRDILFEAATDEALPFPRRLREIRQLGYQAAGLEPSAPAPVREILQNMLSLEFTDDRLKNRIETALAKLPEETEVAEWYEKFPMEAENLLLYFLYRYILRAVWDGLVTEKALFSVMAPQLIFALAAAREGEFRENLLDCAVIFSRETEHSPENLEKMYGMLL